MAYARRSLVTKTMPPLNLVAVAVNILGPSRRLTLPGAYRQNQDVIGSTRPGWHEIGWPESPQTKRPRE